MTEWQSNSEGCSVAVLASERELASVSFDTPPRNRKPQAGPTPFSRPSFVDAVEAVKDIRLMFGRNSRSLISDLDGCLPLCISKNN